MMSDLQVFLCFFFVEKKIVFLNEPLFVSTPLFHSKKIKKGRKLREIKCVHW